MRNTITTNYIEILINAGFDPVDYDEHPTWPKWLISFEAAIEVDADRYLVANYDEDEVTITVQNRYGIIDAELKFDAPEEEIRDLDARALLAVVEAWSR